MAVLAGAGETKVRSEKYLNCNSLCHQVSVECELVRFCLPSIPSSQGHAHSFILVIINNPIKDYFLIT